MKHAILRTYNIHTRPSIHTHTRYTVVPYRNRPSGYVNEIFSKKKNTWNTRKRKKNARGADRSYWRTAKIRKTFGILKRLKPFRAGEKTILQKASHAPNKYYLPYAAIT